MKKFFFISYVGFLILFVIYSYLFVDAGLIYLKPLFTNFFQLYRVTVTELFILFLCIFFGFYALFLKLIMQNKLSSKEIKALILSSGIILLFAYPAIVSFDIFNYIATAKVMFFYHENPYIVMPIAFTTDPLLLFMHAANKTALYAPVWILLTGIPYLLGFSNFLLTLLTFKLFVALFYIATVWLLQKMTKSNLKTAFFALNPLVLFETFVSSHNDIVMMFFLLYSLYYMVNTKRSREVLFFLLSVGIKYATLILSPLFIAQYFKPLPKEKLFFWMSISMFVIFLLSSTREEIYPWYTLWFFLPSVFLLNDSLFTWITTTFTFSMLLRYIPFMLLGTYFGPTPLLKIIFMWTPVAISTIVYLITHKKKRFL